MPGSLTSVFGEPDDFQAALKGDGVSGLLITAPISKFASDSPLEGTGFEPLVPRDAVKVSRAAHVASA
jgi:hypothetical protein